MGSSAKGYDAMSDRALSVATQALQTISSIGFPFSGPLVDKTVVGAGYVRVGITVGTGATDIAIELGRNPTGCITINSITGAPIYQTAADQAASSGTVFVCRSLYATASATIVVI
jgi:hypothetical protein